MLLTIVIYYFEVQFGETLTSRCKIVVHFIDLKQWKCMCKVEGQSFQVEVS